MSLNAAIAEKKAIPDAPERPRGDEAREGNVDLISLLRGYYQNGWSGKERAISVFRNTPDALIYPALERGLRDHDDPNFRNAAMEIYTALSGRSLPPLTRLLRDADEELRTFAGVMLGNIREKGVVPDLIAALADPDLNVKHAAAEALGKIGDPRAVGPLVDALGTDMWLQFPAAMALGELGDRRAVRPLIALLDIAGANIPAIQALGKLGDPDAIAPLCKFLEDDEPSLREWALEAVAGLLARTPDAGVSIPLGPRTAGILIATLASDSRKARRNAAIALGRFNVQEAAAALAQLLADRDIREDALEALIRIGGEAALSQLELFAKDPDPLVRRAAATALAGIGTKRSLKAVLLLLSDPAEEVRAEVALALGRSRNDDARRALSGMFAEMTGAASEAEKKALEAYATITKKQNAPHAFDPNDLVPLRNYISERLGLHYDDDRLNVLHNRLSPLAAAGGFGTLREFHLHLLDNPDSKETLSRIIVQLTNNETYFFREMAQLTVFIQTLLPELVRRKQQDATKKIRVLSAGCSSGEEAYTLAMLLEEAGLRGRGFDVDILGMDINDKVLATARQAHYLPRSFRTEERKLVNKYFRCEDSGFFLNEHIKETVNFKQGNITDKVDNGRFDIIFCRNVLIYFSDATMERVAGNFHDALVPGGYLLLGHSESFCRLKTDFVPLRLEGAVVYQKQ